MKRMKRKPQTTTFCYVIYQEWQNELSKGSTGVDSLISKPYCICVFHFLSRPELAEFVSMPISLLDFHSSVLVSYYLLCLGHVNLPESFYIFSEALSTLRESLVKGVSVHSLLITKHMATC